MALFTYQPPAYDGEGELRGQVKELYRQNRLLSEQLSYMFATLDDANMTEGTRKLLNAASTVSTVIDTALLSMGALASKQALELLTDTVDGKVTTFYHDEAPIEASVGDLWIDTGNNNTLYRFNGDTWINVDNADIAQALADAGTAQATADGKIVSFVQGTSPEGASLGDLWIDTSDENKLYRWNGEAWGIVDFGTYIKKKYITGLGMEGLEVGIEGVDYTGVLVPAGLYLYENGVYLGEYTREKLSTQRAEVRSKITLGGSGTGYYDFEMSYGSLTIKYREGS